jgi:hypothetical protein
MPQSLEDGSENLYARSEGNRATSQMRCVDQVGKRASPKELHLDAPNPINTLHVVNIHDVRVMKAGHEGRLLQE